MITERKFLRWWPLFLTSSLGLFFELAIIRWISGEVRLFAYFKNLSLLAAFLGLSVGFALVGKGRNYLSAFAPFLGLLVMLVFFIKYTGFSQALVYPSSGDEYLWATKAVPYWLALLVFLGMVLVFFLMTMSLFIPLGQATGEEMAHFAPIPAYTVNILASLTGVWLFTLLSYLQTPPVLWFGLSLLGIGLYLAAKRMLSRSTVLIFVLVLIGLIVLGQGVIWSPYQRLEIWDSFYDRADGEPVQVGYTLNVQQVFYQRAINLSPEFLAELEGEIPEMESWAAAYNLPYRLGPEGSKVLIVGAGMGNDVAAALRNGAGHVDAVEIDPAILALGRDLHPERPYDDSRVSPIVDDARSFFEKNTERYDMVVFGLLDSHTLLSGLSNVRLDSFVYTIESFEQVREHLAEDGIVALTFCILESGQWIEERLGRMLIEVFGSEQIFVHYGVLGTTFVVGPVPSDSQLAETSLTAWQPNPASDDLPLTTDDWPYIYMRARKIPAAYWQVLLLIGVVCLALISRFFPTAMRPNWHFWLLGAAFLLVEFKIITELALLFGTTWLVNALAISGVLLMALGANLVVLWRPHINLRLVYVLLFVSLTVNYFLPLDLLIGFSPVIRALGSMILLSLPLFFAGLIFGESLRRTGETAWPLASNLSGSVAGGVLEYGSLLWGVKSLYLIAAVVYVGALLASRSRRK